MKRVNKAVFGKVRPIDHDYQPPEVWQPYNAAEAALSLEPSTLEHRELFPDGAQSGCGARRRKVEVFRFPKVWWLGAEGQNLPCVLVPIPDQRVLAVSCISAALDFVRENTQSGS